MCERRDLLFGSTADLIFRMTIFLVWIVACTSGLPTKVTYFRTCDKSDEYGFSLTSIQTCSPTPSECDRTSSLPHITRLLDRLWHLIIRLLYRLWHLITRLLDRLWRHITRLLDRLWHHITRLLDRLWQTLDPQGSPGTLDPYGGPGLVSMY